MFCYYKEILLVIPMALNNYWCTSTTYFPDLTGKPIETSNIQILQELLTAKTETCLGTYYGESTPDYIGHHKWYTFRRYPTYWLAEGQPDENFSKKIYFESALNQHVLSNGYHAHVHPAVIGRITHYHIMTQEALNKFVEMIDKHMTT